MEAAFVLTTPTGTLSGEKKRHSGSLKHDLGDLIHLAGSGWSAMEVLLAKEKLK